ncbi:MAG: DNA translocase FtsK [Proteobacteria bacterium]|nr:DNA translocase FtsK [Pseudomonadota bacterium]
MFSVKALWDKLFQAETPENPKTERVTQEIKGSIYSLIALFEFIALTSYLPLDSFNLFSGRFDHINNMGGLVGALFSELFLGTLGIVGYSVVLMTIAAAFCAFRGVSVRTISVQLMGGAFATFLGSIASHLFFSTSSPEASLLQGGWIGKTIGGFLENYLNTTGTLILVSGGFLITLLLSTGLSLLSFWRQVFPEDETSRKKAKKEGVVEEELETQEEEEKAQPKAALKSVELAPKPKKPARKSRKKSAEVETESAEALENEIPKDAAAASQEENEEAGEKIFTFKEVIPFKGSYSLPSPRLLKGDSGSAKKMSKGEIRENIQKLCEHLLSFQITGEVVDVSQGPVLTTYEFKPSAGVKLSKIAALQDDLGIVLGTRELRIVAPIPGKTVVGIEVPRPQAETITLKELVSEKGFEDKKIRIPVVLGKATDGTPVYADLASMPHLLVAGQTGSGKSVFINSLLMSFLYRMSPHQLRLILVDPKMLELNVFDGLPHLITNVITDNGVAYNALSWAVMEMERRYGLIAATGSKNLDSYNEKQKRPEDKLPFIVIVVDELADVMMSGGELVEVAITRLAQKARAAGIHLVIATQRPSTDVITGLIKANIPSRLAFKVPSGIDSRTVLDTSGAEELIGRGDCLMTRPAVPLQRMHGTFVTEEELKKVVKYCINGKDYSSNYIDFSGKNPNKKD